jgi:anti-sigma B factor antagonist
VDFNLNSTPFDRHTVVRISGEVDVHSASHLQSGLLSVFDAGSPAVILDLSQLLFIDSTGLGALVASLNVAMEREVDFLLAEPSDRVVRLLEITGLDHVFTVYRRVEDALVHVGVTAE